MSDPNLPHRVRGTYSMNLLQQGREDGASHTQDTGDGAPLKALVRNPISAQERGGLPEEPASAASM